MFNLIFTSSATSNAFTVPTLTYTTAAQAPPEIILELEKACLKACPGWLAPNGDYHACNYPRMQRHYHIAAAILADDPLVNLGAYDNPESVLIERGYVRVDYEVVLASRPLITREQHVALKLMLKLMNEHDEGWKNAKRAIRKFLKSVTVMPDGIEAKRA